MATTYMATARSANIGSRRCPLIHSDLMGGAFFRSMATSGSGRRIVGTRVTLGRPLTARLGSQEGAITASPAAAPGLPIPVMPPSAAGSPSTSGAASRGFVWRGRCCPERSPPLPCAAHASGVGKIAEDAYASVLLRQRPLLLRVFIRFWSTASTNFASVIIQFLASPWPARRRRSSSR